MSLQPSPATAPTELVAIFLKRNGRDELRFVPTCAECGELVLDLTEANVAVVGGMAARLKPAGTHNGAKVSRLAGRAFVFCWPCDRKHNGNLPWSNSALVFRNRDDASQQPLDPPFHSTTAHKVAGARKSR